ncbi:helicase associated domain-containing protein [Streptomyces yokosukanensis]|uniref:helicase associated domain-containing protein n=1 Tax=Streptomyces yokosukanensis TaxID=67386 RepID=UPI003CC5D14C
MANLVVPVLLGPGETADNMLTSRAYGGLAKILEALRAHDTRMTEALAEPQTQSRVKGVQSRTGGQDGEGAHSDRSDRGLSLPAQALLRFSSPRDPAALPAFIRLRVLNPEHEHWRRGVEAAVIYAREHGDLKVPFTYRVPAGGDQAVEAEGWPASLAAFPLGQWITDARRFHTRGDMDKDRVKQLETLGMVWSHHDITWEEGLTAARGWAAENGHLSAPTGATHQGYRVGLFLKNARAAARRAQDNEQRHAQGLPVQPAEALSEERREQLEDIDPSWCPAWPVDWQRAFHLIRQHLEAGGELPHVAGHRRAPGRGPRTVGEVGPAQPAQAHHRAAVDVSAGPRHPARSREQETAAPHTGRQMGRQPRRRHPVLRTGAGHGSATSAHEPPHCHRNASSNCPQSRRTGHSGVRTGGGPRGELPFPPQGQQTAHRWSPQHLNRHSRQSPTRGDRGRGRRCGRTGPGSSP